MIKTLRKIRGLLKLKAEAVNTLPKAMKVTTIIGPILFVQARKKRLNLHSFIHLRVHTWSVQKEIVDHLRHLILIASKVSFSMKRGFC